jgi:dephospho-CoA kinase
MRVIGVTGGVGAGKSTVLDALSGLTSCIIIRTDDVAKQTIAPDGVAYKQVVGLLGKEVLGDDGIVIDRKKMAAVIFADRELCAKVDSVIHPLTMLEVKKKIAEAEKKGIYEYVFVEAALLIEAGYDSICEEFWYVYVPEEERIKRLMSSRGYSRKKCLDIMANQLSDEEFRKHCRYVIDNSSDSQTLIGRLEAVLKEIKSGGDRI